MTVTRVQATFGATLTHTFTVGETPTDAAGAVTVTVRRLDGTTVSTGPATLTAPDSGTYTYALPGQADPDILVATWAGTIAGSAVSVRDAVEIVGGFLFEPAELRARFTPLADQVKYPPATIAARRLEAEVDCERIAGHAFVPRFARVACDGTGGDLLIVPGQVVGGDGPLLLLRRVRACSINGTALAGADLTSLVPLEGGIIYRPSGATWPTGRRNVIVEVEYGDDYPPEPVKTAAMARCRSLIGEPNSTIADRAVSFTVQDGGVYRLSLPTAATTGVPTIDSVLQRFRIESGGFA